MKFLDNISVRNRLFLSHGILIAATALIVGMGYRSTTSTGEHLSAMVEEDYAAFALVAEIDSATKDNARNTVELFLVEPERQAEVRQRIGAVKKHIDGLFAAVEPKIAVSEEKRVFNEVRARRQEFVAAFTAASAALESGDLTQAQSLLRNKVLPAIDAIKKPVQEMLVLQRKQADDRAAEIGRNNHFQTTLSLVVGGAAIVLGLFLAVSVAGEIGKGNLDVQFEAHGDNELTDMLIALNSMKEFLMHVMMRIQQSAGAVATASQQIAAANFDLSARTENQASSLEQTAAAMEEMTGTVAQTADATQAANQLVAEVNVSAQEVGELVNTVVSTMGGIHASSQRIHDIIGTIDSIAFQTNILALNAAVEAARAGEQGRGFAVVASEVRSLAQRSAEAAREIKTIIQDNVEKMDSGNAVALQAGQAVSSVVHAIQRVKQSVADVTVANGEQKTGILQVGQAVNQLDEVTQQNAALVEENAAASKNLDDQVQALKKTINRFKIGHMTTPEFQEALRLT